MSGVSVVYRPSSISPEEARNRRALALHFVFDCYAKKNAAGVTSTNGGEQKGSRNDLSAEKIIP